MYAQVVVLTYQSPEIDSYTYEIPEELEEKIKVGQIVSVPFGKRSPMGLVIGIDKEITKYKEESLFLINQKVQITKLKTTSSIVIDKPLLLPYQIELLKWMSAYYMAPMVNCLKVILPEIPKKLTVNSSQFTEISVNSQQSTVHQTLVLVPSINHLPQTLSQFPKANNYAVYTSELKPTEKFNLWQKIQSGQMDFIFGSRSTIFTPCPNLKKIIIFDEHDGAFKDDRSPYFDTITIAEKICELTYATLDIVDSSPKITTYFSLRHSGKSDKISDDSRIRFWTSQNDKLQIPTKMIKIPNLQLQTKIISLANERKLGNFSPISLTLEEIIKRAYAKSLTILLFLNKKIESGSIYCKSCKHQEFFKTQPDVCPNCQSPEIFFNSTNINSLAKEVKKILPSTEINVVAEGVKSTVNSQLSIVTIATSSVFYKLLSKKYDLVAHLYADSPLNFNEYNSAEEIYSQITSLKKLTRKLLIVQTYNEDLPAIKFAVSGNYEAFYKSEIGPRQTLNYPPYSLLIKISIKGKNERGEEKQAENKAQKLFDYLKQSTFTVLGPFQAFSRNAISYNIILKIPLNNYSLNSREKALDKIKDLIPRQKDVRIIIEPKNLNQ